MHKKYEISESLTDYILNNEKILIDEGFEKLGGDEDVVPLNASWRGEISQNSRVYMKMVPNRCNIILLYVVVSTEKNKVYTAKECGICY